MALLTLTKGYLNRFDMKVVWVFIDGSVDNREKIGYGACLVVDTSLLEDAHYAPTPILERFEHTSSAKLEVQVAIWALGQIAPSTPKIVVYTDSQNVIGLGDRRKRLEKNSYLNKNGQPIEHGALYQEFFKLTDQLNCTFVKVKGHMPSKDKNYIEKMFTVVDRAARHALRNNRR